MADDDIKTICSNRRARREYHIEGTFEAGLVLVGSEVKSLRNGKSTLKDSYARLHAGEMYLMKAHIGPYDQARENHEGDETRLRHALSVTADRQNECVEMAREMRDRRN